MPRSAIDDSNSNRGRSTRPSPLMARASARPSIPGMCMSISATEYGRPASAAARSSASAAAPSLAIPTSIPYSPSCRLRIARLVALSSTTRVRARFFCDADVAARAGKAIVAGAKEIVNQNTLPLPGVLRMPISPPIIATRSLEMVSPRPVPPNFRVVEASAWANGVNNFAMFSSVKPTPVSSTSNLTIICPLGAGSSVTRTHTWPCSVNLIALPTRFRMICRSRAGSPFTMRAPLRSMSHSSSRRFRCAASAWRISVPSISRSRSKSTASSCSRPASILEKSSTSLSTVSKPVEELSTIEA